MRLRELTAVGIHAQTISRLVKEGVVMQVARGLYELSDADISGSHTLAEVAKVIPGGVICLLSYQRALIKTHSPISAYRWR